MVVADRPYEVEPLFTRDPRQITDVQILMAMLAIRGVYERHGVTSLNHGIGFNTAAIELLLPTYGESWGCAARSAATGFSTHPDPDPRHRERLGGASRRSAARSAWRLRRRPPDVFMTGHDGSARSNRMAAQTAGLYAIDMFIGSTLQIDRDANTSTVTAGPARGFGGAPNLGSDAGRTPPLPRLAGPRNTPGGSAAASSSCRWWRPSGPRAPGSSSRWTRSRSAPTPGCPSPVMVYGDDVTHVVTEEGVAYLYKCPELGRSGGRRWRRSPGSARIGRVTTAAHEELLPPDRSPSPRTSGFAAPTPGARCSRRAPSRSWSSGRAGCTGPGRGSEAG